MKKPSSTPRSSTARHPGSSSATPTREQVLARTRDLALRAGHPAPHVTQRDYEQAKLELTGEPDREKQAALLDEVPPGRAQTQTGAHPEKPARTYVLEPESVRERSEIEQLLLEPDGAPPSKPRDDSGPASFPPLPAPNPPPARP